MKSRFAALWALSFLVACGRAETLHETSGTGGNGRMLGSGGLARSGGTVGWDGATGGSTGTGSVLPTGGRGGAGGGVSTGGAGASGGPIASGGDITTGGAIAVGGIVSTGGNSASGGAFSLGGSPSSGGMGAGGTQSNGGNVGTGGSKEDGAVLDSFSGIDGGAVAHADANLSDVVDASPSRNSNTPDATENTGPMLKLVAGALGGKGMQDGTGPFARFYDPMGVTSDGKGNLFVADQFNHTIRKIVVATGAVTTLAGSPGAVGYSDGTGTSASFNAPSGVAYDGVGNLFVADAFNHTIRKSVIATGEVTTLAGAAKASGSADGNGGTARSNYPGAMLCDGAGNLLVADTRNSTIRKIVISTGAVTTLVGSAGSAGSVDGSGSSARLNNPVGMGSDGLGNLFFADSYNH